MARKTQTKLLKMVCKRAEAMRVPYRYSPWTSQCNQTNKTSLSTNNTNKKIQSIKSNTVKCQKNMTKNSQDVDSCQTGSTNANNTSIAEHI